MYEGKVGENKVIGEALGKAVFEYVDYRRFLREFYESHRLRGMSYRAFSRRAGLKSPNYLKMVIEGQRNLSAEMAERFASACDLEGDAKAYFCDLVAFNQASNAEAREVARMRISAYRKKRRVRSIRASIVDYCSTWYLPAIRELLTRDDALATPEWIGARLFPKISKAKIRDALTLLERLQMIDIGEDGHVNVCEQLVSTGEEIPLPAVAQYHRTMMKMAAESIDRVPSEDREISSVTFCLSEAQVRSLKTKVQRFLDEVFEESAAEDAPVNVVQLNFQLFPLSKEPK